MNEIGIRQGRLSRAVAGRARHFPWHSWKAEFARARACGFNTVDWLFAAHDYEHNPIWTDAGQEAILTQIADTGILVGSLCADYFMVHPFLRVSEGGRRQSITVLNRLVVVGARVGIRIVVVPALEASEIRTVAEMAQLLDSLNEPLNLAEAHGVRLALETDLSGLEYRALFERRHHPALGVCYDTGNAAARGHAVGVDVRTLGPYLYLVHIKDRKQNGPSVPLGEGDADFGTFFKVAAEVGYRGPLILEAAVGDEPVSMAMAHLAFVKQQSALVELGRCHDHQSPSEIDT